MESLVNKSNDDALDINSLPNEAIMKIFHYIKQNQLCEIARVCKRWNMLTRIPLLWKKVNVKFSPSHGSPTTITQSFINRLPSCVTSITLDFSDNTEWTEMLDFEELCTRLQEKCPHLKELILANSQLSCNLSSVVDLCTEFLQDVKKLVFLSCAFSDRRSTDEYDGVSKMETLVVYDCGSYYFDKPPFCRMPCLKQLHLFGTNIDCYSWFEEDTSLLNQLHVLCLGYTYATSRTFAAIQDHGINLKELCLCLVNLDDNDLRFNKSIFSQLKTICLRDCFDVTCEGVVSLLLSCQSLENVHVSKGVAEAFAAHPFVVASSDKSSIVKAKCCNHMYKLH